MNERIKEFAIQSGLPTALDYHQKRYEKFAELIVRDCVMCMYRRGVEGFGILEERMLKEHFGVEE